MNRNEEFFALARELENTPPELEYTLQRALARRRHERRAAARRRVFAPLGGLAAAFAAFALLINLSPSFAYAAGRIPLLRELAQAVAASPSLSAAVEQEYVQPVELEQTQNGITARIEYAIVDQKQLNLFYSIKGGDADSLLAAEFELLDHKGAMSYSSGFDDGELQKLTADYIGGEVPDSLSLVMKIFDRQALIEKDANVFSEENGELLKQQGPYEPEYLAQLQFTVQLDPCYTSQGEQLFPQSSFELDGQRLTLETAEIYPTHMRFSFSADESNTAWLKALSFYVENEDGERFEGISNGISASGSEDSPMMETFMLESAFFAESSSLTMHINGAMWLDKDRERILVDLENKSYDELPEGVCLETAVKKKNGWVLTFSGRELEESHGYQLFGWSYFGMDGTEHEVENGFSSGDICFDESTGKYKELSGRFAESFELYEYTDSSVWLCPQFTSITRNTQAVTVNIK